jgi:hypothetical protein
MPNIGVNGVMEAATILKESWDIRHRSLIGHV